MYFTLNIMYSPIFYLAANLLNMYYVYIIGIGYIKGTFVNQNLGGNNIIK